MDYQVKIATCDHVHTIELERLRSKLYRLLGMGLVITRNEIDDDLFFSSCKYGVDQLMLRYPMNSKIDVCFILTFLLWHDSPKKGFESSNFVVGSNDFFDIELRAGSNPCDPVGVV